MRVIVTEIVTVQAVCRSDAGRAVRSVLYPSEAWCSETDPKNRHLSVAVPAHQVPAILTADGP